MGKFIKRLFDLVLALILFVPASLVLLCGILFVKIVSPEASPIFKQERGGYKRKLFTLFKLRSMTNERDENGELLPDEGRLKKGGKIVRATNMDELFQIWNILKGEMSIIGPRPALWNQYDLIAERDKYGANDILPGLTGWAQVHGRDELEIEEKAKLDGYYVKHLGFKLDVQCFFLTIKSVLKSEGVVEGKKDNLNK